MPLFNVSVNFTLKWIDLLSTIVCRISITTLSGDSFLFGVHPEFSDEEIKKSITSKIVMFYYTLFCLTFQMAEDLAESMVNLASSDAGVRVTLDQTASRNNANQLTDPVVLVHHHSDRHSIDTVSNITDVVSRPSTSAFSQQNILGAVGGIVQEVQMGKEQKDKSDAQTRSSPTNPMSVSVPNLPTSMEQTVNLLETFAAVARRNPAGGSSNNMRQSNNAVGLVRIPAASSPSEYCTVWLSSFHYIYLLLDHSK